MNHFTVILKKYNNNKNNIKQTKNKLSAARVKDAGDQTCKGRRVLPQCGNTLGPNAEIPKRKTPND